MFSEKKHSEIATDLDNNNHPTYPHRSPSLSGSARCSSWDPGWCRAGTRTCWSTPGCPSCGSSACGRSGFSPHTAPKSIH